MLTWTVAPLGPAPELPAPVEEEAAPETPEGPGAPPPPTVAASFASRIARSSTKEPPRWTRSHSRLVRAIEPMNSAMA